MRAFWWFEDDAIAGMARPGFNAFHWFDLPFDEAALMGWVGLHSTGTADLAHFREHLKSYVPKVHKFYRLTSDEAHALMKIFETPHGIADVLSRLAKRTHILESYALEGDRIHLKLSDEHLAREIAFLKGQGINRIVSLTEKHHAADTLEGHFGLHHISVNDLAAPSVEQVHEFADLLARARASGDRLAVHCLAGIGRTSTMLMAGHIVLGGNLEDLQRRLTERNPKFAFTGPQSEFVRSIKPRLS